MVNYYFGIIVNRFSRHFRDILQPLAGLEPASVASTAGVDLSLPPVAPADVPALFLQRFWDIYLRWGRDVYLRCFWCLPPVAPADVPAIPAHELGHLPAVLLGHFVVLCVKNAQNTLQLKKNALICSKNLVV